MPPTTEPIELCLESLDAADDEHPYVRCVALTGSSSGLGLTQAGKIVWQQNETACLLIWVSADGRLIVQRRSSAAAVRLTRAERFLDLPEGKPVVALHEDVLEVEGHAFRVHVHGVAQRLAPPLRLPLRRAWVAGAVTALSMAACHTTSAGTAAPAATHGVTRSTELSAAGGSTTGFAQPPPESTTGGYPEVVSEVEAQGGTPSVASTAKKRTTKQPAPPIEIRNRPPAVSFNPQE